jgi:hypothetical protein
MAIWKPAKTVYIHEDGGVQDRAIMHALNAKARSRNETVAAFVRRELERTLRIKHGNAVANPD